MKIKLKISKHATNCIKQEAKEVKKDTTKKKHRNTDKVNMPTAKHYDELMRHMRISIVYMHQLTKNRTYVPISFLLT